jgi:sigma-B regulation protein RsbU (phosphoserine phosphatase)
MTMLSLTGNARATRSYSAKQGYSEDGAERVLRLISGLFELLALGKGRGELERAACAFVAEHIRADRVVLIGERRGVETPLDIHARWTREEEAPDVPLQLSGSIIRQVMQARESVLVSNDGSDGANSPGHSFIQLNLRSAMAAPLFDNERVRGIIYVDTSQRDVRYEQADVEVLTAVANAVAVKLRNLLLESEIQMGAEIQRLMLPAQLRLPGYDIAARYVPARMIGGDLYDFITVRDGCAVLLVADVTGKGLPAALLMANTQATMRAQTAAGGPVSERVGRANRLITTSTGTETFVTAFYAELDASAHRLSFCNAGHEHPYLFHGDGSVERLATGGLTLGILPGFEYQDGIAEMRAGDTLLVFTDGITDATNNAEELFGAKRLENVVRERLASSADDIAQSIIDAVNAHAGGEPQFDDLTLMVVKRP